RAFQGDELNPDKLLINVSPNPDQNPLIEEVARLEVYGSTWTFAFSSGPGYKEAGIYGSSTSLFIVSALAVVLLAGLSFFVSKTQLTLEQSATEAQTGLLEAAAIQRAVLDSANYSIIVTDKSGTIRLFNKAAERMLGYKADEVVGKVTPEVIHDAAEVALRAKELSELFGTPVAPGFGVFVALAERGIPDERPWSYIRKDKSRFAVTLCVTAVKDANDALIGFMGIAQEKK
ncbi:MAG: hypothetical protein RL235_16, partial [Chlamydiota bacterium]